MKKAFELKFVAKRGHQELQVVGTRGAWLCTEAFKELWELDPQKGDELTLMVTDRESQAHKQAVRFNIDRYYGISDVNDRVRFLVQQVRSKLNKEFPGVETIWVWVLIDG